MDYSNLGNGTVASIANADFNNDGHLDLVTTDGGSPSPTNQVTVFLNQDNGQFGPGVTYHVGAGPTGLAVGNLGNGQQDIVTANANNTVSVLLGNGNGTFLPAVNYLTGGPTNKELLLADFNGDGNLDVAVSQGTTVTILLGNGNGTFSTGQSIQAGPVNGLGAITVNSVVDVVASISKGGGFTAGYTILLGNGNGTFSVGQHVTWGARFPGSVLVGNFVTGSATQDFAIADSFTDDTLSVFLGNGDGTFSGPVNVTGGSDLFGLAAGVLTPSGNLDLVATDSGGGDAVVFLGNGDGTYKPGVNYFTGSEPQSVTLGDFNRDGHLDIATGNSGNTPGNNVGGNSVTELFGRGDGTFTQVPLQLSSCCEPTQVITAHFTSSGHADLAVADAFNGGIEVFLGNGNGTFAAPVFLAANSPTSIAAGDFNGDGKTDLVSANPSSNNVSVFLGNGNGTFLPAVNYATDIDPGFVAVGSDSPGKGNLDIVTTNYIANDLSFLIGNGDGTFKAAINIKLPIGAGPTSVAGGDFNGDGHADLLVAEKGLNQVALLLGNGNGTFQPAINLPTHAAPTDVIAGDFNGDGSQDWAVSDMGTFSGVGEGVQVFLGNGNGTFRSPANYGAGIMPDGLTAANLNNRKYANGKAVLDLIAVNSIGNDISVLLNNGDGSGTYLSPIDYVVTNGLGTTLSNAGSVVAGDWNGDGTPDLAVANTSSDTISILYNDPAKFVISASSTTQHINVPFTTTVTAEDQFGNIVTNYQGTVTFSNTGAPATLPKNDKFTATDAGVDTYSVTYTATGSGTLTVTDTVNTAVTGSIVFTIVSPSAPAADQQDGWGSIRDLWTWDNLDNFFVNQSQGTIGVYMGSL
jgi:hypothetical protein